MFLWIDFKTAQMGIHVVSQLIPKEFRGFPRIYGVPRGFPWFPEDSRGFPGFPWACRGFLKTFHDMQFNP